MKHMRHIIFLDPLEKLKVEKDSTLLLAQALALGREVYLLFEDDFYFTNTDTNKVRVYNFEDFSLTTSQDISWRPGDVLHMRIDPPFDSRYMRYLWMLLSLEKKGVQVLNSPRGLFAFNEKLYAYQRAESLPSFVGAALGPFLAFVDSLRRKYQDLIVKPLDLYQGIGVEKWPLDGGDDGLEEKFLAKVKELGGPLVVQPFFEGISEGEVRAIFFQGQEIGHILKVPPEGSFLANIVQGARYTPYTLSRQQLRLCQEICRDLSCEGVHWVAFDLMGDIISEVNITCPGLLVEASRAHKENLATKIVEMMN